MDYLWTPWRYPYVTAAAKDDRCVFCDAPAANDDSRNLIVLRAKFNYIILNRFPYTSGHVLVVPYAHHAIPSAYGSETLCEMMELSIRTQSALETLYHPNGYNLGMNIGRAAGAGIAGHIHMHVLPRWVADANFVSVVCETRILPEMLEDTWKRMKTAF